jgi:hypothetical protein
MKVDPAKALITRKNTPVFLYISIILRMLGKLALPPFDEISPLNRGVQTYIVNPPKNEITE